jgi:hypothetical protein
MRFLLVLILLATPAFGQNARPPAAPSTLPELPDWDGREHCERTMRMLLNESALLLNACVQQEDRARNMLRATWPTMPAGSLRSCVSNLEAARMRSYFMLHSCVEQERNAIRDLERRPPR